MSKLNKDVLILILEELEDDIKSLYSCLLVNKTWYAKYCFSELKFLHCYGNIKKDTLKGLARISKSIKKLILEFSNNNSGAIKLIDTQRNLCDVIFNRLMTNDESFCKVFEELLIKHVDTIKYLKINWMPVTRSILYLVNLKSLEIDSFYYSNWTNCSYLENLSLPSLKFLKVKRISSKILVNLIENTRGLLTEICIDREGPKVESLELFFENWKGKNRNPMLLQTSYSTLKYFNLTEKYKAEGIIKKYYHNLSESTFENFEWLD
ncbi:hypothetical protein GLOIN_2v1788901 [Rhizophagus irregularis DAOM 181602=DAOM 197198]|nr:hypothetical protein GLOIN_2v1788901 [Rhizophagus irregularis DAOM 181602=DAOM 197198]